MMRQILIIPADRGSRALLVLHRSVSSKSKTSAPLPTTTSIMTRPRRYVEGRLLMKHPCTVFFCCCCCSSSSSSSSSSFSSSSSSSSQKRFSHKAQTFATDWNVNPNSGIVSYQQKPKYQVIVGLEVHVQLCPPTGTTLTALKLFSPSITTTKPSHLASPNTIVHPYDAAIPGYLPIVSHDAITCAVKAALSLDCTVSYQSRFERKHYYYADLPAGYQITQQRWPIARNGTIPIRTGEEDELASPSQKHTRRSNKGMLGGIVQQQKQQLRWCRIERIQLEHDTAKSTSATTTSCSEILALIDLNRCGTALIEIVTSPDLRSAQQAKSVVQYLHHILTFVGITQGRMEWGEYRVDVNVNLQQLPHDSNGNDASSPLVRTTRVEVKNLNSFQHVELAIQYEAIRQAKQVQENTTDGSNETDGATTSSSASVGSAETRTWNASKNCTELLRRKEEAHDYRFMPEPDLPPIVLDPQWIHSIRESLPELPTQTQQRLMEQYNLSHYQAHVLVHDSKESVVLLEDTMRILSSSLMSSTLSSLAKLATNLIINEVFALLKGSNRTMKDCNLTSTQLAEVVQMLHEEIISMPVAKKLLTHLTAPPAETSAAIIVVSPRQLATDQGWVLITNLDELKRLCQQVLQQHPTQIELYYQGQTNLRKLFIGKVMAATNGLAHPERLQLVLQQVLDEGQQPRRL